MTKADEVRDLLKTKNVPFTESPIQYGIQFRCDSGEVFTVYDSGSVVPGGNKTPLTAEVAALSDKKKRKVANAAPGETAPIAAAKTVFIVHGHDEAAKKDLRLLLHEFKLEPVVLQDLAPQGDTIIEKLEGYVGSQGVLGYACVLLTPDDEGHKAGESSKKQYRARQNVVLELGMVLARSGRKRVTILHKGTVELPSDISGLLYIPFNERVDETKEKLFQNLRIAGLDPKR